MSTLAETLHIGGTLGRIPNRDWDVYHLGMQTQPLHVPPRGEEAHTKPQGQRPAGESGPPDSKPTLRLLPLCPSSLPSLCHLICQEVCWSGLGFSYMEFSGALGASGTVLEVLTHLRGSLGYRTPFNPFICFTYWISVSAFA